MCGSQGAAVTDDAAPASTAGQTNRVRRHCCCCTASYLKNRTSSECCRPRRRLDDRADRSAAVGAFTCHTALVRRCTRSSATGRTADPRIEDGGVGVRRALVPVADGRLSCSVLERDRHETGLVPWGWDDQTTTPRTHAVAERETSRRRIRCVRNTFEQWAIIVRYRQRSPDINRTIFFLRR